ncbi:MAG: tRNA-binding protein [Candidatus Levybacteria bacterium]|nr:tRNA-binding protein [Candidatus Levybacteria bacterium]
MATYEDFVKIDIRVGKVISVEDFPEARKPLYKITVDFGPEIGSKKSAVGCRDVYSKDQLMGRQVLGLVNMAPKKIGPFFSEFLTLGVSDENNKCILIRPDREAPLGSRMF